MSIENNELIADFMKFDISSHDIDYIEKYTELNKQRAGESSDLKYHTSWDWLIPVVDKIKTNDFPDKIKNNYSLQVGLIGYTTLRTKTPGKYSLGFYNIVMCEETKGIKTVYKAVIEFIKWYNKIKT